MIRRGHIDKVSEGPSGRSDTGVEIISHTGSYVRVMCTRIGYVGPCNETRISITG